MMYLGPDLSEKNVRKIWKEQTHCTQRKGVEEDGDGEKRLWLLDTTYIPIVEMAGLLHSSHSQPITQGLLVVLNFFPS